MKKLKNILSLFDGMSGGQQTFKRLEIKIENYFASEVDKYAIQVTQKNFPSTVQLGDVKNINTNKLPKIDFLIGGSPCQSFSFSGKRNGMTVKGGEEILTLEKYKQLKKEGFEFEGQSYLFWEYVRILKEVKPKYFFLENVMMSEKWEKVISKTLGVNPICINSSLVSAQNRKRLYWTNIGLEKDNTDLFGGMKTIIPQPKDRGIILKDVLENNVDKKYNLSDKMLACFQKHKKEQREKGKGFGFNPTDGNKKAQAVTTRAGGRPDDNYIITPCDKRTDEGLREKKDGKTWTLCDRARTDESCGQLVKIERKIITHEIFAYTEQRTEEAKQQRKEHKAKTGKDFSSRRGKELTPRTDGKMNCLTTSQSNEGIINQNTIIRRLTPIECERLQGFPDNYSEGVSDSQRYKMLGNGWQLDTIEHIFKYIKK
jgi:DNA (cytosine-5)-methyltransferase 3A